MKRPSDPAPTGVRVHASLPAMLLALAAACALSAARPSQAAAPGALQIPQRQVQPSACPIELAPAIAPRALRTPHGAGRPRRPWSELQQDYSGWHPEVQAIIDAMDHDECYRWALNSRE